MSKVLRVATFPVLVFGIAPRLFAWGVTAVSVAHYSA